MHVATCTRLCLLACSRAGDDHGSAVWRRLLRRHRHRPRAQVPERRRPRGVLQPAELHQRHQRALRAAAARRHRQEGTYLVGHLMIMGFMRTTCTYMYSPLPLSHIRNDFAVFMGL